MRIISAIDSMKGSLTSISANSVIKEVFSDNHVVTEIAISDGGEGMVDAFVHNFRATKISIPVSNLFGKPIETSFAWIEKEKIAVIESASTSGIQFINKSSNTHPRESSTRGVGETIKYAAKHGAKKIIIGLGGTGTIDCGVGALYALGVRFYDEHNNNIIPTGKHLGLINKIDTNGVSNEIKNVEIILASDVVSQLIGSDGAVYMFGKQKGLQESEMEEYEEATTKFSHLISSERDFTNGDGAAGGLGFGLRQILNAEYQSGLEVVLSYSDFYNQLKETDLLITGEGKLDSQSLKGKVPVGLGNIAKNLNIPVIAFVGSSEGNSEDFANNGLNVVIPIIDGFYTIEDAMQEARSNLLRTAQRTKTLLELL